MKILRILFGLLLVVVFLSCSYAASYLPPSTTPGAINPEVTQKNIQSTICVPGYTKTIRPKVSYTNKLKLQQMKQLHLKGKPSDYEEDHLISLEIGGNPTDPKNLWPESYSGNCGAHIKDKLENKLHILVCSGKISLIKAQHDISTNWVKTYNKYYAPIICK